MGHSLPSECACRSRVHLLADSQLNELKIFLCDTPIFLVIDESEKNGKKYFNIFVGRIGEPLKTILVECKLCATSEEIQKKSFA